MFHYIGDPHSVVLMTNNFNWGFPVEEVPLRDSMMCAFDGSMGYRIGNNGRVEVEVGYEEFRVGNKKRSVDKEGIYVLVKELAYDATKGHVGRLAKNMQSMMLKRDMHYVTKAIKTLDEDFHDDHTKIGCYYMRDDEEGRCSPFGGANKTLYEAFKGHEDNYGQLVLKTSDHIALQTETNLNQEERGVVAGALAQVVDGAEVVEII